MADAVAEIGGQRGGAVGVQIDVLQLVVIAAAR
jgi:hypothetical protein